jgi:outer membrane lipoprotein carrier protein
LSLAASAAWAADETAPSPSLEKVLEGLEARYSGEGFSCRFLQTSHIAALDITDTASGRLLVKEPGKMRWEYEQPEPQVIISDGTQLWIYRPDDRQVLVGKAPALFGDGKGASFLSDISRMREHFSVTLEERPDMDDHLLRLVPEKAAADIEEIYLTVSWASHQVEEIVTVNTQGDRTRITLFDQNLDVSPDDELFRFTIPEGTEVLRMESEAEAS